MRNDDCIVVALAGNPNVGKSTVFNALTGLNQHTGNWSGKTVVCARGYCNFEGQKFVLVDLPGCYSLNSQSAEEKAARDFICFEKPDAIIVVCDAACLERNLILVLQVMEITPNVVLCVNLMDEAKKKSIEVDINKLSVILGVPVVGTEARNKKGLDALVQAVNTLGASALNKSDYSQRSKNEDDTAMALVQSAEAISRAVVNYKNTAYDKKDRTLDKILTGKLSGFSIMFLLLMLVFWITIVGANYPSAILAAGLFWIEDRLLELFVWIGAPRFLSDMLVLGVYRVLAWVVSVMLPPMAIFFPLFTLLEDSGYLPRIAFNLDKVFKKCHACGKQALTMCMVVARMLYKYG